MQNQLNKLNGKSFKYGGKMYTVKRTKITNQKAVVFTNGQTFVKTASELEVFMDDIEFVDLAAIKSYIAGGIVEGIKGFIASEPDSDEVVEKQAALQAEVIVAESTAQKVSNKLMEVFENLSGTPTDETYRKAEAMVKVSNSIVNVQMAQIKFLALKK